jgi:nitrogen regulatory protein P-II 1
MKEIKAYIRRNMVGKVIEALEQEGFRHMTLIDVKGITTGLNPEDYHFSLELAGKYMNVVKLEMIYVDEQVEQAVGIIQRAAHTGRIGDGLIFVTTVDQVVRIATGQKGEAALQPEDQEKE